VKHVLVALLLTYIMPSFSVLKRVANNRDELTVTAVKTEGLAAIAPVLARQLAPALSTSWTSGELPLAATISVRYPGRCRIDLTPTDGGKTATVAWANGKKRSEGPSVPALEVAVEQLCATLALKSSTEGETRGALERHLASLKVDTRQVALGRFEGAVVFVLGEKTDATPYFEVYKDRFLPARVHVPDPGGAWDVRFVDYTSQATGDWLPRVVEVWRGKELNLRLSVLSADGHAALEGVKF
jgi:hypothetical protein